MIFCAILQSDGDCGIGSWSIGLSYEGDVPGVGVVHASVESILVETETYHVW